MSPAAEYMLNTSLTLGGIVLLAWLLVYISRRWERATPRGPLELLGTLRLESKRSLYLVRIGERVVALGASEGGMIKVLELAHGDVDTTAAATQPFGDVLRRLRGLPNAVNSDAAQRPPAPPAGSPTNVPSTETNPTGHRDSTS